MTLDWNTEVTLNAVSNIIAGSSYYKHNMGSGNCYMLVLLNKNTLCSSLSMYVSFTEFSY